MGKKWVSSSALAMGKHWGVLSAQTKEWVLGIKSALVTEKHWGVPTAQLKESVLGIQSRRCLWESQKEQTLEFS